MDKFDKEVMNEFRKGQRVFWIIFAVNSAIGLGLFGAVIYVAWHFIQKFW